MNARAAACPSGLRRSVRSLASSFVAVACLFATPLASSASVYSWVDERGVRHFTNSARDLPEDHAEVARSDDASVRIEAGAESAVGTEPAPTSSAATDASRPRPMRDAYLRGLREGIESTSAQVRAVTELASKALDKVTREPSQTIVVQGPTVVEGPTIIVNQETPVFPWPWVRYGFLGPYAAGAPYCGSASYGYGFDYGRFPPHSHFYPSRRRIQQTRLFFPDGHFSRDGYLFGNGFIVE